MNKNNTYDVSGQFHYEYLWDTFPGQDGAIYGDYLFRFDSKGFCRVFSMTEKKQVSSFLLDRTELIMPHSNAVCFGNQFYEETDEFPLLYTNIYNSYKNASDRMEGVCCVYRLTREGLTFCTRLVQIIKVGFTEQLDYWKSLADNGDVRPYGNFVVDTDHDRLYAFTMRDAEKVTRYFAFRLPHISDGVYSEQYQTNVVTLETGGILQQFDCAYSKFIQGACYHDNKLFSVEGFTGSTASPRLQVIDLVKQEQCADVDLFSLGLEIEPEFIEFHGEVLYYSDATGKLYKFSFMK